MQIKPKYENKNCESHMKVHMSPQDGVMQCRRTNENEQANDLKSTSKRERNREREGGREGGREGE